jgi:hypothetical protein
MRRFIATLRQRLGHELGSGRVVENLRRDLADRERALAAVDALAARLAARSRVAW